jgi:UrcA family protein
VLNTAIKAAALSLLTFAAVPAMAHAGSVSLKLSDLDLSQPTQVAMFNSRIDQVARKFCLGYADVQNLSSQAACRKGVRAEVMDKLSASQRQAVTSSRTVLASL